MSYFSLFQSPHPVRGATGSRSCWPPSQCHFNPRTPRGVRQFHRFPGLLPGRFQSTHPARGATPVKFSSQNRVAISIHAPREGCDKYRSVTTGYGSNFNPRTPRGVRHGNAISGIGHLIFQSTHPARGATSAGGGVRLQAGDFNPRTPRGVRQQTLLKSREFAWLNLLICTRGRRLSIQKQTRLCSIKLSFMLFGCEPAGEGVSSWTSHATKSKVRLEGRSAYSQSVRSSAHSDFPGNKSGGCPVRDP